jgi:hypothetical protein
MKILPVGSELFHDDGRTDIHEKDNNRLSQFCEKRLKRNVVNMIRHEQTRDYFHENLVRVPSFI